MEERNRKN